MSKYTEDQIQDMRLRADSGESRASIARDYDEDAAYVSQIVTGEKYKTAPGPIADKQHNNRKLTKHDIDDIREARLSGWSLAEIADEWRISKSYAGQITRYEARVRA